MKNYLPTSEQYPESDAIEAFWYISADAALFLSSPW